MIQTTADTLPHTPPFSNHILPHYGLVVCFGWSTDIKPGCSPFYPVGFVGTANLYSIGSSKFKELRTRSIVFVVKLGIKRVPKLSLLGYKAID